MRDPSPPRGGNLMDDGDERCVYAQAVQQQQAWMWEEKLPPPPQATPRIKEPVSCCQALTSRFD